MGQGFGGVNALTGLPFNSQYLLNDPYFLEAYKSANINAGSTTTNTTGTTAATASAAAAAATAPATSVSFKGNSSQSGTTSSSNGTGWAIATLLGAGVIGGGAYIASKGRVKNQGFWKQFKSGFNQIFKNSNEVSNKLLVRQIGGKKVIHLPGDSVRTIEKSATDFHTQLRNIGIDPATSFKYDDEIAKIADFTANFTHGGKKNQIFIEDGKIVKVLNDEVPAKDITHIYKNPAGDDQRDFAKEIDKFIEKVIKKEKDFDFAANGIKDMKYTREMDGVIYRYSAVNSSATPVLESVKTNRYAFDDPKVCTFRNNHKDDEVGKLLERWIADPSKTNGLKEFSAIVEHGGEKWLVLDDEVIAIWKNNSWCPKTDDFFNQQYILNNKDGVLDNIVKKHTGFKDYVYSLDV